MRLRRTWFQLGAVLMGLAVLTTAFGPRRTLAQQELSKPGTRVFGYLEAARVAGGVMELEAKLDTGADNSSLHARILKKEERAGQEWITFELSNKAGEKETLERQVVRIAKVKKKGGGVQIRPVVMMKICLGTVSREVEVNLVDRADHSYRMLIGRSFLVFAGYVDSSRTFTSMPNCQGGAPK